MSSHVADRTQAAPSRAPRSAWLTGGLPMAALMLIALVSLYMQVPASSGPAAESAAAAAGGNPAVLPGFLPGAWFLPADERLGFVEIAAGPFLAGSDASVDPQAFDNEFWADGRTDHRVNLDTYYIARYEVTVAQFRAFVEASGFRADPQSLEAPPDHPVSNVSWTDALAYSRWLDTTLREWPETPAELANLLRQGWRITLPDELEWEKAARGVDGRIFPWGNEPRRDRANYQGRGTVPVGSFQCGECAHGLQDMSGNVWEWTRTPFHAGPHGAPASLNPEADALWVMRGGSFGDPERNVRAALRGGADPGARRPFIGFRVVLTHGS
jgi:formylglycine-generating enzyme required for sulfatase activity